MEEAVMSLALQGRGKRHPCVRTPAFVLRDRDLTAAVSSPFRRPQRTGHEAEKERRLISERTKAALAAKKAQRACSVILVTLRSRVSAAGKHCISRRSVRSKRAATRSRHSRHRHGYA